MSAPTLGCGTGRRYLESHGAQVGVGLPHGPHDGQEDGPLHTIRETCVLQAVVRLRTDVL